MSFSWSLQCYLFIVLNSLNIIRAVPSTYCLAKMNDSDCHMPPQQVFSYYRPGSRCEIETWRGCPTDNKFDDEYHCSMHCLFKERFYEKEKSFDQCKAPININKCDKNMIPVFTHVNGKCISASWGGCPTPNKFLTKSECDDVCKTKSNRKELLKLHLGPLQEVNKVLKGILEEEHGKHNDDYAYEGEYGAFYDDLYDGDYRGGDHYGGVETTEPTTGFYETADY